MYIQDLALNNPQGLICLKAQQTNQPSFWSANVDMPICRSPLKNFTYVLVSTSPAVPSMSWLPY